MVGDSQTAPSAWGTPVAEWEDTSGARFHAYSASNGTTVVRISGGHWDHNHDELYLDEFYESPWEIRLRLLQERVADTIRLFGRFNTGWIPSKGHQGLSVDHVPTDHNAHQPSPLDLRRVIRNLTTPRPSRVP